MSLGQRKFAAASFLLPALLFLTVCAVMGFAPFGESSILIFDLSDQFVEFLCALKHGEVFFSWNNALGGSYIGTFSYYVSSPFSLLSLLCPDEHMPIAVVFLVALKLGLAGLTFSLLLRRRTGRYDLTTVAFSLCYALMAYNMAYAMSFMWLDGVLWLPVLLMGAEDILDGKRPWLLLGALVVSFVSTWYISYMTGLFTTLYLLWRCACDRRSPVKPIARLAGWAGLALMLSAWLWLPTVLSMLDGKLADASAPLTMGFNWPLSSLFYKLFVPGAYDSVTYTGSAFLYCSLPAAVLALVWFLRPGLSRRAKLATMAFGGFLLFNLWFAPLDRAWHLFQPPNSFPGRWSFVVSCFILLLAYDALLWLLSLVRSVRLSKCLCALLALVLAVDMGSNALLIFRGLDEELHFESYASYYDHKVQLQPLTDEIRADTGFSRTVSDVQRSRNEPAAFGYKGLDFFSSSYNANVNQMLGDLGLVQKWFWSTGLGSTPITDLLLGVNYHISDRAKPDWYTPVAQNGELTLYRTAVSPAPVYFAQSYPLPSWSGANSITEQSRMLSVISGEAASALTCIDSAVRADDASSTTWTFATDGGPIYGAFLPAEDHDALLYVNDVLYGPIYTNETDCLLYLGTFPAGEQIEVTIVTTAPASVRFETFCELDTAVLTRAAEVLAQNALQVTACSNGRLEGNVVAPSDGWLYSSIPATPGWTVEVDGKPVECGAFRDTLLTIPVAQGTHTISMRYTPPGLYAGLGLTTAGLLLLVVLRKKYR